MARKVKEQTPVLCDGVRLSESFYEKKENRVFTLLVKGFIVYLLAMGAVGFYLSAMDVSYNEVLCHFVILIVSLLCALLYYRLLVENLGYLALFFTFGYLVLVFRDYINSGYYAMVNITIRNASEYFDVDVKKLYTERIGNRYLTITLMALFVGVVLAILLNVFISRRMQYANALFAVMFLNVIPLYLVFEPGMLYTLMIVTGLSASMVIKGGRHYNPLLQIKRSDTAYELKEKRKKREFSYVYDVKAMLQAGALAAVFSILVVSGVHAFRPVESFNVGYKTNKYKELTMSAISTVMLDGFEGLMRDTRYKGGLRSGELGSVSSVRLDHQTDLIVQFTPYDDSMLYLRGFVGEIYNPYQNEWTTAEAVRGVSLDQTAETNALEAAYDEGDEFAARGQMRIRNVDGGPDVTYRPYYTAEYEKNSRNFFYDVTYYPRLQGNMARINPDDYENGTPYTDADLYVPAENVPVIEAFVRENGMITDTSDQLIIHVMDYFQENIPYTVRPGKTPKGEDFVNYFLTENKKGYCAHYASAAVLIFRYMGIPARYVEGYAVSYDDVTSGELMDEKSYAYSDYYDGFSVLGETAMVEVEAKDDDAHAWVEVYSAKFGWIPVDVTPASSGEEDVSDFWSDFERLMGDGDSTDGEITDGGNGLRISQNLIKVVIYVIVGVMLAAFAFGILLVLIRRLLYLIRYTRASESDKLVMNYAARRKKRAKKDEGFKACLNYKTQVAYLAKEEFPAYADLVSLLERAGYAAGSIGKEEFDRAIEALNRLYEKER